MFCDKHQVSFEILVGGCRKDYVLSCAFDASRSGLVNVDMCYAVFLVLLCVEGYGCETDGLARPPADALEGEDRISVVGEGFVLFEREGLAKRSQ